MTTLAKLSIPSEIGGLRDVQQGVGRLLGATVGEGVGKSSAKVGRLAKEILVLVAEVKKLPKLEADVTTLWKTISEMHGSHQAEIEILRGTHQAEVERLHGLHLTEIKHKDSFCEVERCRYSWNWMLHTMPNCLIFVRISMSSAIGLDMRKWSRSLAVT